MHTSTRHINIQVQSFGNYLRDMWIVALIFVLFQHDTTVALPFIWIGLQLVIATASLFIFRKIGPNMVAPFIVPSFILLLLFLYGSTFWLFLLGVGISIWRIQARFNTRQDEQTIDTSFSLLFFVIFLLVHFSCFMLGLVEYRLLLYTVFVTGIALFVGIRLFSILINTNKRFTFSNVKILSIYFASITIVASCSAFIYFMAPFIRKVIDVLFGAVMGILVVPFGPLMGYLEKLISKWQIKQVEEGTQLPVEGQQIIEPDEVFKIKEAVNFPIEWILFGVAAILIIFFIRFLIKNKPDQLVQESIVIEYDNTQLSEVEEEQKSQLDFLSNVETSFLREKYIQFETVAHSFELERNRSETVREWFIRMEWKVNNEFFSIYEEVRYGGHTIDSDKAELFIKALDEIKDKYFFEKDV